MKTKISLGLGIVSALALIAYGASNLLPSYAPGQNPPSLDQAPLIYRMAGTTDPSQFDPSTESLVALSNSTNTILHSVSGLVARVTDTESKNIAQDVEFQEKIQTLETKNAELETKVAKIEADIANSPGLQPAPDFIVNACGTIYTLKQGEIFTLPSNCRGGGVCGSYHVPPPAGCGGSENPCYNYDTKRDKYYYIQSIPAISIINNTFVMPATDITLTKKC